MELVDNQNPVYLELTGEGYNIMLQKPDKFDKFKVDLVLTDADEIAKAEEFVAKYGLKIKDELSYPDSGALSTKSGISYVTFRAKHVPSGDYPRPFVPTISSETREPITDFMSHGAKMTVRFKVYSYKGGTSNGHDYPGGNAFQLEKVRVHEYTPYESDTSKAAASA